MVAAALLVDDHRVLRNIKVAITETFFHIDKNIGEIAVLRDHVLGGVVALASGILAHGYFGRIGARRDAIRVGGLNPRTTCLLRSDRCWRPVHVPWLPQPAFVLAVLAGRCNRLAACDDLCRSLGTMAASDRQKPIGHSVAA